MGLIYAFGGGGGGKESSPLLYNTENINNIIAADTNMTKIEYNDFEAMCLISIMSHMPKIANIVKNNVKLANNIEIPFLNIILKFLFIQI